VSRVMVQTTIHDPLHDTVAYRVSTVQVDDTYETAVFNGPHGWGDDVDFRRTSNPADALRAHNELTAKWTNVRMLRRFGLAAKDTSARDRVRAFIKAQDALPLHRRAVVAIVPVDEGTAVSLHVDDLRTLAGGMP
jgi:hypothetical protein